jgi:hypothetical protein
VDSLQKALDLAEDKLLIYRNERYQILGGSREPGFQRSPVPPVRIMFHQSEIGNAGGYFAGDLTGAVGAAVVDQDNLVIQAQLLSYRRNFFYRFCYICFFVVSRENNRKTVHF